MDGSLHRQVLERLAPLLVLASVPWFIAAFFYLDPLKALGFMPAAKASWGEHEHSSLMRVALLLGMSLTGPAIGTYIGLYMRARRGERFSTGWRYYALFTGGTVGGILVGVAVYWVLAGLRTP